MKLDKAVNAVKTCLVLCIVMCIISIVGVSFDQQLAFIATILSLISFILSFVIVILYCKCPYCGKHIVVGMFKLKRCPKCHRNLATGEKAGSGNKKKR